MKLPPPGLRKLVAYALYRIEPREWPAISAREGTPAK
jgi:hypothetical protein